MLSRTSDHEFQRACEQAVLAHPEQVFRGRAALLALGRAQARQLLLVVLVTSLVTGLLVLVLRSVVR